MTTINAATCVGFMEDFMNTKGNQQYQDTHGRIIKTVIVFLQKKELREITVAEVCRAIGINRSTFYEHFLDIYDVMDKTEMEYAKQMADLISENLPSSMKEASLRVLDFIREHRSFYKCSTDMGRQLHIPEELMSGELTERRRQTAASLWENDPVMAGYQWEYMKGSFNAIVKEWLRRGCAETTEQIFDILRRLSGTWSLRQK